MASNIVFVFGSTTTAMQMLGLCCVLGGSYAYAVVKRGEKAGAKLRDARGQATTSSSTEGTDLPAAEEMKPLNGTQV